MPNFQVVHDEQADMWCVHQTLADGQPGKKVKDSCRASKAEAEALMAEMMSKSFKCGDMAYYVPMGITSLADALAAKDARHEAMELQAVVGMFQAVVENIAYSPDVPDKATAIEAAAAELSAHLKAHGKEHKSVTRAKRAGSPLPSDYLVVEDPDDDSTWHLPVKENGKPNHRLMGAAFAALHGGYRGNRYEGPQKAEAIAKLKKLYESEGLDLPSEKSVTDETLTTVKFIAENRVGNYAVLWGGPDRPDLYRQWFDADTQDLTAIFDATGKLPLMYDHALNGAVKATVVGVVDTLKADAVGLWYEAELRRANEYDEAIRRLVREGKLKTSSQTLASAMRVAKNGRIEQWVIAELSLTPTPAEPRMTPVEALRSAFAEIGCDLEPVLAARRPAAESDRGAEKARWLAALARVRAEIGVL